MERLWPAVVGALFAFAVVWCNLITSKYASTFFLMRKYVWLYAYPGLYALYAFIIILLLKLVPEAALRERFGAGGHIGSNVWFQAVLIGLFITQVLQWRLFDAATGAKTGFNFHAALRPAERWIIRRIVLHHHYALGDYLAPFVSAHDDLETVKQTAVKRFPRAIEKSEKLDFKDEIEKSSDVFEAMELYLTTFGKDNFEQQFLLQVSSPHQDLVQQDPAT